MQKQETSPRQAVLAMGTSRALGAVRGWRLPLRHTPRTWQQAGTRYSPKRTLMASKEPSQPATQTGQAPLSPCCV